MAVAQLGERLAGSAEVKGSIPLGFTLNPAYLSAILKEKKSLRRENRGLLHPLLHQRAGFARKFGLMPSSKIACMRNLLPNKEKR